MHFTWSSPWFIPVVLINGLIFARTRSPSLALKRFSQGRIQDFLKGGSESGVDIEGGANPSIVSLKQGVWGAAPPRSYGVDSTKIPKNARL